MKKKIISMLLGMAVIAGLLAGCGEKEEPATSSDNTPAETDEGTDDTQEPDDTAAEKNDSAKTVLKWAIWDEKTTPYWSSLADAYMEKNPDIKIELVDLGSADYMTVLATDLSGSGSEFDIVTIKEIPGYATLISKGVLEPLDERISAANIDLSKFNGTTEQAEADGKLYQLPFRNDFWILYYNKDIFDEAGVEYPTNDMTLTEYDEMSRKLAKEGFGDEQTFGSHYHMWRSTTQLFGILDGEHTVLDGNYDFMKPYYEMVKSQETDGICRSYVDITASQLHYSAAYSEGNTATMNMGSWFIGTLMNALDTGEYDKEKCGNWGIVKYPHPDGVEAGTTFGSITGLSIPTASDAKDEAWDFIDFVCGEEGGAIIAESGNLPAMMTDEVIDQISSKEGFPTDENSKEALKVTKVYLEAPYDKNISQINTILDTYHKDIMNGDISIDDGIIKMNEEVSALSE